MKNIFVFSEEEAKSIIPKSISDFAVIHITDENAKKSEDYRNNEHCYDELTINVDDEGFNLIIWQADSIIRFCERQFDIDNVFIVNHDRYDVTMNIADELASCYGIRFDIDYDKVLEKEWIRHRVRIKYMQIKNSLLHTLSPLDYCKKILSIMFDQVRDTIRNVNTKRFDGFDFFKSSQPDIYLKNGLKFEYDLDTSINDIYLPDIDDVEYVYFYGVPEISDFSSFENIDYNYYDYYYDCPYGINDYYENEYNRNSKICFNSEEGLIRIRNYDRHIPEKYKNHKPMQRGYWEFRNESAKDYVFPTLEDAFKGIEKAERFLAEKCDYAPKYSALTHRSCESYANFYDNEYFQIVNELIYEMKEKGIWKTGRLEACCAYAACFYAKFLCDGGHCENLTTLKCFFEYSYRDMNENLPKFEKFWNIDKYVASTDDDPVNMLCLAAYTLIETVRPYNRKWIPDDTFMKCLERIYELTEGRQELDLAVIMTGAFAGAYCQSLG